MMYIFVFVLGTIFGACVGLLTFSLCTISNRISKEGEVNEDILENMTNSQVRIFKIEKEQGESTS